MRWASLLVVLALASPARADLTVIYAQSVPQPLVAHPVEDALPTLPPSDPAPPCVAPRPVVLIRGVERAVLPLTDCEGRPDPASLVELSLLARPETLATRPSAEEIAERASDPDWIASGIRRLHPGLLERLRVVADHFPDHEIEIISGFRPGAGDGSRHLHGLAIDLRVSGASLDAVHALAVRFDRTGVGVHSAEGFLHLDVRERSRHWTDAAAAGEPARIAIDDSRPRFPILRGVEIAPVLDRGLAGEVADGGGDEEIDATAIGDEVVRALRDVRIAVAPPQAGGEPRSGTR